MNNDFNILYRTNTVPETVLLDYLNMFSQEPQIPLNKRVDINVYVQKIKQSGTSFEAWIQNELIGILVAYINDQINKKAFITYFRIKPEYRGCGIGKKLLEECFSACQHAHFDSIDLEVDCENKKAQKLYKRMGFAIKQKKETAFIMSKVIH